MVFRTASANAPVFAASTLRLEPATAVSAATVTLQDKKANVSVTEGTLNIVDPTGVQLASLNTGQTGVFQETSAALPAQAAGGPASAFIGGMVAIWVLVAVAAATATIVTVAQSEDEVVPFVPIPPVVSPATP